MASNELQVVILERPIDTWNSIFTRTMFNKMIALKLEGYGAHHNYGIIPLDKTDFFCDHILLCVRTEDGELEPFLGWKSVTHKACKTFHQGFAPIEFAKPENGGSPEHLAEITRIIDEFQHENLRYCSAYTMSLNIRKFRVRNFKDIGTGVFVNAHRHFKTDKALIIGNVAAKVDQMFTWWGYTPLSRNGQTLGNVFPKFFNGAEFRMFELFDFSADAKAAADEYRSYWDNRIVASATSTVTETTVVTRPIEAQALPELSQ